LPAIFKLHSLLLEAVDLVVADFPEVDLVVEVVEAGNFAGN
jgi:hypothetical protein